MLLILLTVIVMGALFLAAPESLRWPVAVDCRSDQRSDHSHRHGRCVAVYHRKSWCCGRLGADSRQSVVSEITGVDSLRLPGVVWRGIRLHRWPSGQCGVRLLQAGVGSLDVGDKRAVQYGGHDGQHCLFCDLHRTRMLMTTHVAIESLVPGVKRDSGVARDFCLTFVALRDLRGGHSFERRRRAEVLFRSRKGLLPRRSRRNTKVGRKKLYAVSSANSVCSHVGCDAWSKQKVAFVGGK